MDFGWLMNQTGLKVPDYNKDLAEQLTLADLAQSYKKNQRSIDREDAMNRVLPSLMAGGYSRDAQAAALAQEPDAAAHILAATDKFQKSESDRKKTDAETDASRTKALNTAMTDISNVAFREAQNPDLMSLQRVQRLAEAYKVQLPPPPTDPRDVNGVKNYLTSLGHTAYAVKDQVENAEKNRHNTKTEDVADRTLGENIFHNRNTEETARGTLAETTRFHTGTLANDSARTNIARDTAAQGKKGTWSEAGIDPATKLPIMVNNATAQRALATTGPDGQVSLQPFNGAGMDRSTMAKRDTLGSDAKAVVSRIDNLMAQVEAHPAAFNFASAVGSYGPSPVAQRINKGVMTSEDRQARAEILRAAAIEVHELYGAALSRGEQSLAQGFIPSANDVDSESVLIKLKAAREYAAREHSRYGGTSDPEVRSMKKKGS